MKTLLLMRHAKSSWDDASLRDFERPLNKRGKRDAPRMGKLIEKLNVVPDLIISSPAKRAASTAKKVAEICGYVNKIHFEECLYEEGGNAYLRVLKALNNEHPCVMLIGHNPDMESLLDFLTDEYHPFPTAALAVLRFSLESWKDLSEHTKTQFFGVYRPKELPPTDED